MPTQNLYWPVYKNLEKEFLDLAGYVHFSDDQLGVYSTFIADLIVRCSVEIEALSKELYCLLGGDMSPTDSQGNARDLYFDTDCLGLLEERWALSQKQIAVSATNFYFVDEKNKILTPLRKAHKRGTSGSRWKQAYQALKHNRRVSLKKASIGNLLQALGALYILNLYYYYNDGSISIGRVYLGDNNFDNRAGSEVFSAHYCRATDLMLRLDMDDSCIGRSLEKELDKSIFVVKYDDNSFKKMHQNFCLDNKVTIENFQKSLEIKNFLDKHPEYRGKNFEEICIEAGGISLVARIVCTKHMMQEKGLRTEAILNKHSEIYPRVFSTDIQTK